MRTGIRTPPIVCEIVVFTCARLSRAKRFSGDKNTRRGGGRKKSIRRPFDLISNERVCPRGTIKIISVPPPETINIARPRVPGRYGEDRIAPTQLSSRPAAARTRLFIKKKTLWSTEPFRTAWRLLFTAS